MRPATDLSTGDSTVSALVVRRLGRRGYADAVALQERAATDVEHGGSDQLLYVEHPRVVTLGRGARADQLVSDAETLAAAGISLEPSDRGGGATYHGPGQLVGYPIIDLRRRGIGVRSFLRAMEAALIDVLSAGDVAAESRPELTGVWTPDGKVAAMGIAVRRGVTRHGFALNVDNDLDGFGHIVPCGLQEPVTSLAQLGWRGNPSALQADVATALQRRLATVAGAAPQVARPHHPTSVEVAV